MFDLVCAYEREDGESPRGGGLDIRAILLIRNMVSNFHMFKAV